MNNYEQKYKKALEAVKFLQEVNPSDEGIQNWVKDNFPELKESEDEKIRKELMDFIYVTCFPVKDLKKKERFLDWLEKQGETFTKKDVDDAYLKGVCDEKHELEKQDKQPTDNDEPKFKVGDWVVYDHRPYQVVELPKEGYINLGLKRNGKVEFAPSPYCRHWSIQDAKDGDVLASELTGSIFLFRGIKDDKIDFYCDYDTELEWPEHRFGINDTDQHYGSVEESQDIHPATKEQRDLLFAKMKEAGYEWDGEKERVEED